MFVINKEITNCSGILFPAGLLVGYRLHTDADQRTVRAQFMVWKDVSAFQKQLQPLPASTIGIFNEGVGDKPLAALSFKNAPAVQAQPWDGVLDDLAVTAFLTLTHGLTPENIDKVGQQPIKDPEDDV